MGCVGSDAEDETRATRPKSTLVSTRFKFPKKFSDDGVAVVYASVPRKLRSANKKRRRESICRNFPSNKKLNRGRNELESSRKVGPKQPNSEKRGVLNGCAERRAIGAITKDEEEVAEALYALSAMFPEAAKIDKAKEELELRESKSAAFLGMENSGPNEKSSEDAAAVKEESGTKKISNISAEAANHSSNVVKSAREELLTSSAEHGIETPSRNTVVSCALSGARSGPGSNIPQPHLSPPSDNVEVLGLVAGIRGQSELPYSVKENKRNGVSSREAHDSDCWGSSSELPASKLCTTSVDTSCSLQPSALERPIVAIKGDQFQVDSRKSRKRSCTHVYISNLIKNFKISERVKTSPVQCIQSTGDEGLKQGGDHMTRSNSNVRTSGLNGIIATDSAAESSAEFRNAILLHKRLLQDQQQASTTSRLYTSQQPNVEFLSLITGGAGGETRNGAVKANHDLGTTPQFDVPRLKSKKHLPLLLPPQDFYSSNAFLSHAGAAMTEQIQFPPILGSKNSPPSPLTAGVTASPKQQPRLQQRQLWTDQLSAYRSPGRVTLPSIIPSWQNGGKDASATPSPSLLQYSPSIFLHPRSSAEALASSNALASRHQQPLVAVSLPLPPPPPRGSQGQHYRVAYG